jgi:sporulation protein YlmC with PRC-barrel domain
MRRWQYIPSALVLGLSTMALAQSPGASPAPNAVGTGVPNPPTLSSSDAADAGANKLGEAADARKLIGKTVQTPTGESLGKVSDVLVDQSHGNEYAIITYGQRTLCCDSARACTLHDEKRRSAPRTRTAGERASSRRSGLA